MKISARQCALVAVIGCFLGIDAIQFRDVRTHQPLGVDFLAMWAGVRVAVDRPASLYDFEAVTHVQSTVLGDHGRSRPFVYPPSAVPVLLPFAFLQFEVAYACFSIVTAAMALFCVWRNSRNFLVVALVGVSPPFVLTALVGQLSFLIVGFVLTSLTEKERPIFAGVLMGVAVAVKPQLLVFFPLALAFEGRWLTLLTAIGAGCVLCAASVQLLGWNSWVSWLSALPDFGNLIVKGGYLPFVITPLGALVRQGVRNGQLISAQIVCVLAGIGVFWWAAKRQVCSVQRYAALIGASLIMLPYAMRYEFAVLAPVPAILLLRDGEPNWTTYVVALLCISFALPDPWALFGLLVCILRPWRPVDQTSLTTVYGKLV